MDQKKQEENVKTITDNVTGNKPHYSNLNIQQPPEGHKKQEEIVKTIKNQMKKEELNTEDKKRESSILGKLSEVESMIKRAEEIKKDSIKLKLLEDMLMELRNINAKFDLINDIIKTTMKERKNFY